MRPMQRKGGGHAQDITRERQQGPPPKRTRTPPRRSEGRNGRATPTGPQTEKHMRDRCRTPEKEEHWRESRTLLRLAVTVRTTSKRAGSYRERRESTDRGTKPIRKEIELSTNDNLRWGQVQCRWSWNRIIGYGRTMERAKNSRRPAASASTTRKNALAAAGRKEKPQTEARTPPGRIQGKAPRTTVVRDQVARRWTCNRNIG